MKNDVVPIDILVSIDWIIVAEQDNALRGRRIFLLPIIYILSWYSFEFECMKIFVRIDPWHRIHHSEPLPTSAI